MRNLFTKILSGYIAIILLMLVMILLFTMSSIREHYLDYIFDDLKTNNIKVNALLLPYLDDDISNINREANAIDSAIKAFAEPLKYRISIIDSIGNVIADSKAVPAKMENHSSRPEVSEALQHGEGSASRYSYTVDNSMLYFAIALKNPNKPLLIIRSSVYSNYVNSLTEDLTYKVLQISLLVLLVAILFAIIFSKQITKPLNYILEASHKIASGDFDVRLKLANKDEFKALSDGFNYMASHIKSLFEQLSDEKEKLNGLIMTLNEGLIVCDDVGKIILVNDAFENIVHQKNIINKYYWEISKDKEFINFFKSQRQNRNSTNTELIFNDRHYLSNLTYIANKRYYLSIFHDITDLKDFAQIKKDLIVNVSHELRTPLTAIKGFVETLEDEALPEQKHYLEIILRHSDRLINIVNDLLILSKLEDKNSEIVFDKVNLNTFVSNVLPIFQQKINDKDIRIKVKISEETPDIEADPFKLEQLFINLIDNSIKYTDAGNIEIQAKPIDYNNRKCVKIDFADSGLGMSKQELNRIFERFYVIDKSRSRKVGGTGLGLSIVKHIVLLHKGEILVSSEKGEGSTFTVILPIKQDEESE